MFETMTQELEEYTCYVETEVTASGEQGEEGGVRDGEQAAAIFIRKPLALSFQKIYKSYFDYNKIVTIDLVTFFLCEDFPDHPGHPYSVPLVATWGLCPQD